MTQTALAMAPTNVRLQQKLDRLKAQRNPFLLPIEANLLERRIHEVQVTIAAHIAYDRHRLSLRNRKYLLNRRKNKDQQTVEELASIEERLKALKKSTWISKYIRENMTTFGSPSAGNNTPANAQASGGIQFGAAAAAAPNNTGGIQFGSAQTSNSNNDDDTNMDWTSTTEAPTFGAAPNQGTTSNTALVFGTTTAPSQITFGAAPNQGTTTNTAPVFGTSQITFGAAPNQGTTTYTAPSFGFASPAPASATTNFSFGSPAPAASNTAPTIHFGQSNPPTPAAHTGNSSFGTTQFGSPLWQATPAPPAPVQTPAHSGIDSYVRDLASRGISLDAINCNLRHISVVEMTRGFSDVAAGFRQTAENQAVSANRKRAVCWVNCCLLIVLFCHPQALFRDSTTTNTNTLPQPASLTNNPAFSSPPAASDGAVGFASPAPAPAVSASAASATISNAGLSSPAPAPSAPASEKTASSNKRRL